MTNQTTTETKPTETRRRVMSGRTALLVSGRHDPKPETFTAKAAREAAEVAQRAQEDAAYAGAAYRDLALEMAVTREVIDDLFADLIGPVEKRLAELNMRLGRAA